MGKLNTGCTNSSPLMLPPGPEEESWIDFEILWISDEEWCTPFGVVNILHFISKILYC